MKMKLTLALCCTFIAALGSLALSAQSNDDATRAITQKVQDGVKADLAGDTSFVQKNYVDNYMEGTSFGNWVPKADLLDTSKNKMNRADVSDIKVNVTGNTAIARFRESYDGIVDGQHRSRNIICTQTWSKDGADWKALATHCSQAQ